VSHVTITAMTDKESSTPPGLDGDLVQVSTGGDTNWLPFVERRFYTNVFIVSDDKVGSLNLVNLH
jgi:hypothetical protein